MTHKNKKYNKNKQRINLAPGFTIILKDMENKTDSQHRDKVLQAQIHRLTTRIEQLDQKKADRRGRKKKVKKK